MIPGHSWIIYEIIVALLLIYAVRRTCRLETDRYLQSKNRSSISSTTIVKALARVPRVQI